MIYTLIMEKYVKLSKECALMLSRVKGNLQVSNPDKRITDDKAILYALKTVWEVIKNG